LAEHISSGTIVLVKELFNTVYMERMHPDTYVHIRESGLVPSFSRDKQRLLSEWEIMNIFKDSPGFPKPIDYFESNSTAYIIMEHLSGGSLNDNVRKSGYGFSLDKFEDKKLVSHLTAQTLQYDTLAERPYSWTLRNYQIRTMVNGREIIKKGSVIDTVILMEPKDFFYVKGQQETLTLPELSEFIEKQKLRGAAGVSTFEVEYHKRFASPFAAFILTLIGASLSSEKRKGGMGFSIGVGIALSFTYIMFQTIFATFAINAGWSPMISVWIPNLIFMGIAFWLYKRAPQ
jgi:hypothetical protein